jgi:hypothetical protein
MCAGCNLLRSNFYEYEGQRPLPVTVACDWCLEDHGPAALMRHVRLADLWLACPACLGAEWLTGDERYQAFCGTCTATSWVSDQRLLL